MSKLGCFSKKDTGGVVLFGVAIAEIVLAVLLFFSATLTKSVVTIAIYAIGLIAGFGYIASYIANSRSRFRPCWFLTMGILVFFISLVSLITGSTSLSSYNISVNTIAVAMSIILCIVSFSTAVQLFYLRLKRWIMLCVFAALNAAYCIVMYFNFFQLRGYDFIGIAIFCLLLAAQTIGEAILSLNYTKGMK